MFPVEIKPQGEPGKPVEQLVREWGQFIGLALAGAWAIGTFIYRDVIVPGRRPAALVVTPTLEEVGSKRGVVLVRARVRVANHSESKVWAPALWYTAAGMRLDTLTTSDSSYVRLVRQYAGRVGNTTDEFANAARHSRNGRETVLAVWKEPVRQTWFEPHDETSYENVFYVPEGMYDVIWLDVDYYTMRNADAIAAVRWRATSDGSLTPILYLKQAGFDDDTSRVEPYDGYRNIEHQKWAKQNGVGETTVRTLLILSRSPSTK